MADRSSVTVVGLVGGSWFGSEAGDAILGAAVLVGSARHLGTVEGPKWAERVELAGPLPPLLDLVADRADAGRAVCVLASGDPGFFGIVRALGARVGSDRLVVHPAPSSVALAFARAGLSWDDAAVVSAHGRSLAGAAAAALGPKVAVLTSPDNPPEALGAALARLGCGARQVVVASRLGEPDEAVVSTDLDGLARGSFDGLSVVVLVATDHESATPSLAWGLPIEHFEHRDGMITKPEVRAIALAQLSLPVAGVLWDVGAGSGSVGIECARLRPGLRVVAVERHAEDAARIRRNAAAHGVDVDVVVGAAPAALAELPDPNRVFVGGGGIEVLDACLARLAPAGVVVATYALVERALEAERRLGRLTQVGVARGVRTGDHGIRLRAENPVFVCAGPQPPAAEHEQHAP